MRDGNTREVRKPEDDLLLATFLERNRVVLVVLTGDLAGSEYAIDQRSMLIGRGPGVDLGLDNDTMSRQHAVLEFVGGSYRVRDAGSRNGVRVNGASVQVSDLKHGDRLELGEQAFQYVVERRESVPKTHVIPES